MHEPNDEKRRQQLIEENGLVLFCREVNMYDSYSLWATPDEKKELDLLADIAEDADKAIHKFQVACNEKYGPVPVNDLLNDKKIPNGLQVISYWEDGYELFLGTIEDQTTFNRLIAASKSADAQLQQMVAEVNNRHAQVSFELNYGIPYDELDLALEESGLAMKIEQTGLAREDYYTAYSETVYKMLEWDHMYGLDGADEIRSFLQVDMLGKYLTEKGVARETYEEEFVCLIYRLLHKERPREDAEPTDNTGVATDNGIDTQDSNLPF